MQRLYWAQPTQIFCVALILGSFACDVAENEIRPAPGSKSQKTFDGLDMFFNVVFILELLLNMAAHWFLEFWKNRCWTASSSMRERVMCVCLCLSFCVCICLCEYVRARVCACVRECVPACVRACA